MHQPITVYFDQIPDFRRTHRRRFELSPMLTLITMALISGRQSLREIASFLKDNAIELCAALGLDWTTMPSHVTIGTIMHNVAIEQLSDAFNRWACATAMLEPGEPISLDGKALGSTLSDPDGAMQDFACIVSAYCQRLGIVIATAHFSNRQTSEIAVVRELIDRLVPRGVTITADALHSTKKRSKRSSPPTVTTS